jgi:hypothetical protein
MGKRWFASTMLLIGIVVSHPCDKNKNVARVGHLALCWRRFLDTGIVVSSLD